VPLLGTSSAETDPPPRHCLFQAVAHTASEIDADLHRRVAAAVAEDQRDTTVVGMVVFEPDLPLVGLKARLLYEKLSNLGTVCYFDPPIEEVEDREELDAVRFGAVAEKSAETIRRLLRIGGVRRMTIEPLDVAVDAAAPASPPE